MSKPTLSKNAETVLSYISKLESQNQFVYWKPIAEESGLPPIQVISALLELQEKGYAEPEWKPITGHGEGHTDRPVDIKRYKIKN